MAPRYHKSPESPLSPMSVGNGEKQTYHYEAVSADDRLSKAAAIDQRMKRKIRRLRIIQRSLTLITSALVLGFMINTYVDFVRHRTIQSGGQTVAIYPTDPITWPTFMMIATGAVSTLFSGAVVIAYFWGVAASNRVSMWSNYWSYLMHVVNLCVWLATSTTLQMLQGAADAVPPPRDLYGWTCSNKADDLVGQYGNQIPVDFNFQCETQTASFAMGIINAAMEVFSISISIYAMRRMIHKKRMELMDQRYNNGAPTA